VAKKPAKSKDGSTLRNSQGRRDDTGIDNDELSQSDIRTGTGSETGTQSEGDPDSQALLEQWRGGKEIIVIILYISFYISNNLKNLYYSFSGIHEVKTREV
jgi:hypothetical protein